jgi:hypothetical protein
VKCSVDCLFLLLLQKAAAFRAAFLRLSVAWRSGLFPVAIGRQIGLVDLHQL